jgi:hypothetical protein
VPYASDRDRPPHLLELEQTTWPAPPLNLFLTGGAGPGVYDLRWQSPGDLALNAKFNLHGVNIYRSFDSEFGPFERITDIPVGSIFWRDQTDNVVEPEEVVQDTCWVLKGTSSAEYGPRYVFRTLRPIVKSGSQNVPGNSAEDVQVFVDGVQARVLRVLGAHGEVELDATPYVDVSTQKRTPAVVPGDNSVVTVTYRYNRSLLKTDLAQRVFYRITSVGTPTCGGNPTELVETPLEHATSTSNYEIEKIDYMWQEGVRRNGWILNQGGERVKVFLRRHVGQQCLCYVETNKQPVNDCLMCFGTGILGGFEGPYDIVMGPDDAEKRVEHSERGRSLTHEYEVFMGPRPLLSHRDFIVKINGERYSIGPVRMPTNRGMVLQQHFTIGHIDEKDIRYRVPIDNPRLFVENQLKARIPPEFNPAQITDKTNIPDERELRGRNVVWGNIVY